MRSKITLLGDAGPSWHFGSKLVTKAILSNFKDCDVDVIPWNRHYKYFPKKLDCDLIVVNGEGSIHDGHHMELLEIAKKRPSVLINCVYQNVPQNDCLKHFKYVSVRESLSKKEMEQHGVSPEVVPDVIFSHEIKRPKPVKDLCVVGSVNNQGICDQRIMLDAFHPEFIEEFGRYKRAVIGRFHAVCLAMMWGMPFTAYASNTHKIIGMIEDFDLDHCCLHQYSLDNALEQENINKSHPKDFIAENVSFAKAKIKQMFSDIRGFL